MSPQVLRLIIQFVDPGPGQPRQEFWKGLVYAFLLFFVASIQTLILAQYFQRMFIVGLRIRTALISAVYRKALIMSNSSRKESTVGEIVNLMAGELFIFGEPNAHDDIVIGKIIVHLKQLMRNALWT